MRSLRARVVRVMLGALVVASLAGCAASPVPAPTASATPDAAAPLFASDEEALAAAEEAYAALVGASNVSTLSGGVEIGQLRTVATGQALEYELTGAAELSERSLHTVGETKFEIYRLRSVAQLPTGSTEVTIYVCDDLSDVDVVDVAGTSVVKAERQTLLPYEVVVAGTTRDSLIVSSKELWTSGTFC